MQLDDFWKMEGMEELVKLKNLTVKHLQRRIPMTAANLCLKTLERYFRSWGCGMRVTTKRLESLLKK